MGDRVIEALGNYIITICVAIFFATAVQMLLPDNSLKKYCNFVIGLIVFVVMLSPLIKIFNQNVQINKIIEEATNSIFENSDETTYEEYRNANINNTLNKFKENIEKQCVADLEEKFKGDKYKADIAVSYDDKNNLFVIDSIEVGINDGSVARIKKIQIGEAENVVQVDSKDSPINVKTAEVREFVSSRYDVNVDQVSVYNSGDKWASKSTI